MAIRTSPRIAGIPHYEPGLTMSEVMASHGLDSVVKLASNESPFPPLPQVKAVIDAGIDGLNRYPDGAARALREALADQHAVDPAQVAIGNGSCELIVHAGVALLDPGTTIIHATPSFAMYPHLAAESGAEGIAIPLAADGGHDLHAMAAAVDERTRLVVICNPNNPTGTYRSADQVEEFLDLVPDDLAVLVDEAYYDFVDLPDRGRVSVLARTRPNLLVTRTFSKAYGLCGLRVGYGIGSADWVRALDAVRQPFNTNELAQAAALESLRHPAAIQKRVDEAISERARVADALAEMGVPFTPSRSNFILMQPPDPGMDARVLHESLLARGVIVRDGSALGAPGTLRVTIGTPSENDVFLAALAAVTGTEREVQHS
ncbi:MAG: histidinol-phosphate transaminase [Thermoleophilia bacterium]|nr:histidinol-phosphate transaminase [Thermoleophilia bacterium]